MNARIRSGCRMGFALLVAALAAGAARAESPRAAMRLGERAYDQQQYDLAVTNFARAAQAAPAAQLAPAPAVYNQALGEYRRGHAEEAARLFTEALRTPDIELQSRVYYNLGNLAFEQAGAHLKEKHAKKAVECFQQAAGQYVNAMTLQPDDEAAKFNFELALVRAAELQGMAVLAITVLERADRQIDAADFAGALHTVTNGIPEPEVVTDLNPEFKKRYEALVQRIPPVVKIQEPGKKGGP